MICGSLCTMNDVLCSAYPGTVRGGDRVVFMNTGAYSFYEGMSLFLSHELPGVVLFSEERGFEPAREQMQTYRLNMQQ
jgi:diaminopimelate decarboxylase